MGLKSQEKDTTQLLEVFVSQIASVGYRIVTITPACFVYTLALTQQRKVVALMNRVQEGMYSPRMSGWLDG